MGRVQCQVAPELAYTYCSRNLPIHAAHAPLLIKLSLSLRLPTSHPFARSFSPRRLLLLLGGPLQTHIPTCACALAPHADEYTPSRAHVHALPRARALSPSRFHVSSSCVGRGPVGVWCELARITTVRCGAFHVRYLHTMPHGLSAPEEEEAEEAEEEEEEE
jgi:hypothetical protein